MGGRTSACCPVSYLFRLVLNVQEKRTSVYEIITHNYSHNSSLWRITSPRPVVLCLYSDALVLKMPSAERKDKKRTNFVWIKRRSGEREQHEGVIQLRSPSVLICGLKYRVWQHVCAGPGLYLPEGYHIFDWCPAAVVSDTLYFLCFPGILTTSTPWTTGVRPSVGCKCRSSSSWSCRYCLRVYFCPNIYVSSSAIISSTPAEPLPVCLIAATGSLAEGSSSIILYICK